MFRGRTFSLIILALLLAVGAVWVAKRWADAHLQPLSAQKADTVPVIVAALEIPFGQKVEAAQIRTLDWPRSNLPTDYLSETTAVVGRVSTQTIYPGEVVNANRIREHLGGSTLSALITPTMRALTVRVNDVAGVAGFLLPGNRVDVLATRRDDQIANTRTLIEDLKVLAVDQEASQDKEKPLVVRAVTIEVTPEQAEVLVKATEEGTIQLALRNPLDQQPAARKETVAAVTPPPPVRKRTWGARAATGVAVTIIKGTTASQVKCTAREC